MNFHFKQALEYLKTPEGKAESILRGVIDSLKSICVNQIVSFHFFSYSTEVERINTPYITTICFSYKNTIDMLFQTYRSIPVDTEEANIILKIIETHLTEEGYNCVPENNGFLVTLI